MATFKAAFGTGEPFSAWDALSLQGKESIIGFIGLLEVLGEAEKPHYMMGGKSGEPGDVAVRQELPREVVGGDQGDEAPGRDQQRPPRHDWRYGLDRGGVRGGLGPAVRRRDLALLGQPLRAVPVSGCASAGRLYGAADVAG